MAMRTKIDKIWNFDELEAEIEGIGRCFAQIENIKRQSLNYECYEDTRSNADHKRTNIAV